MEGKIFALCRSDRKGTMKKTVECARFLEEFGLEGCEGGRPDPARPEKLTFSVLSGSGQQPKEEGSL